MSDWEVSRSNGRCVVCNAELAEGQEYFAALLEVATGFDRKDYCPGCWGGRQPAGHFCFWKTRVPIRERKKQPLIVNTEVLMNFFERLGNQTDAMKVRFRFVLALLLMRKKLLRYEQTMRSAEVEQWQMRQVATNTLHQVENPKMDEQQIAEVSAQLSLILRGDASDELGDLLASDPSALSESDLSTDPIVDRTPLEEQPTE
jgi:hypothetical protein